MGNKLRNVRDSENHEQRLVSFAVSRYFKYKWINYLKKRQNGLTDFKKKKLVI